MLRLRARSDDEDSRWRHREQELVHRLEDVRTRERKLEDQKHNLEVCLADATQQIQELKVRFFGFLSSKFVLESYSTCISDIFTLIQLVGRFTEY